MNRMVWRVCAQIAVLSLVATLLNIFTGAELKDQVIGLVGALIAAGGAAWYTVGTRFPGALAAGLRGALSGLVGLGCAITLITGYFSAVQLRFAPSSWTLVPIVSLALYALIFVLACTLACWCITEVVLRDRARAAAVEAEAERRAVALASAPTSEPDPTLSAPAD